MKAEVKTRTRTRKHKLQVAINDYADWDENKLREKAGLLAMRLLAINVRLQFLTPSTAAALSMVTQQYIPEKSIEVVGGRNGQKEDQTGGQPFPRALRMSRPNTGE